MTGLPMVREITEGEYRQRRDRIDAAPEDAPGHPASQAMCEGCEVNAEELRTVGMDHRNYAPGLCPDCDTEWPRP